MADQLFDAYLKPLHPARRVVTVRAPILASFDSPESVEAGIANLPNRAKQKQRVLDFLTDNGPATDDEIIEALGTESARPRRINLTEDGLVERKGTGRSKRGNPAALWGIRG